ncbi:MAG: thiosulfate oxidation carrier protein SoxY [Gammaproteobacteria bacterium]|nr:thiosulfate oxidation carrier protein SoxY [Gammaproteobacteria bacterium]MCW8922870.1 thiosulfate oxidation carrier protein SoxY [Gammaproteobacteria bacterium]
MDQQRRILLKSTLAASATGMAISAGLLTPKAVLAAWNTSAFTAKNVNDALTGAYGSTDIPESDKIKLKAPELAQSGSKVTLSVTSNLDKTESISFLVKENIQPLCATFNLGSRTEGYISTNVKIGKSSDVIAIVKADGKLYSIKQYVKVAIGGCGG